MEVHPAAGWAEAVAERWRARLAARPELAVCLPTGDTPRPVYAAMAEAVAAGRASLADAEVFLLDEFGGLAPDHPGRCEVMLRRDLLDRVDVAAFHRLDPDAADVAAECERYAAAVAARGLDLAIVGLGANGHVGLNEPGSTPESGVRRVTLTQATAAGAARYAGGGPAPTWGLTLGMAQVLAAREVWLVVTGAHKAAILQRALEGPVGPAVPATFLRAHPRALVLADVPAAGELTRAGAAPIAPPP